MQKRTPVASAFDLNLLEVFEEVYKFSSVTKAADALNLSPSGVSQSLQKLRIFFSDPLFVRAGQGMTATTLAEALHAQLSNNYNSLLAGLEALATAASKDILVVHCSTYLSLRILPQISIWVAQHAPDCKVVHRDFFHGQDSPEDLLLQRGVDLVFDMLPVFNFALKTATLYKESTTFICRTDHPRLGSCISREEATLEKFALFDSHGLEVRRGQVQIQSRLGDRNFKFVSGSVPTIAAVVAVSDTVGVLPVWLYEKFRHIYDIRSLSSDVEMGEIPIYMMYSKTSLQNEIFKRLAHWLENDFYPI